jgi:hypothetical protein
MGNIKQPTGFKELLNSMMTRRWLITLIVLLTFMATALNEFPTTYGITVGSRFQF